VLLDSLRANAGYIWKQGSQAELQARFAGRIVPVDTAIAERWGWLAAEAKRK